MRKKIRYIILGIICLGITIFAFQENQISQEVLNKCEISQKKFASEIKNKRYTIIIDYSRNIFRKRLWVWDNEKNVAVINCRVSQAKYSGLLIPNQFSNEIGSDAFDKNSFFQFTI
jgi:hypothetical protein